MEQEHESSGEESEDGPEAGRSNAEDIPEPGEVRGEDEEAIEEAEAECDARGWMGGELDEEEGVKESKAGENWNEPGDVE